MDKKKTILIVDDDVELLKVLSIRLADSGYDSLQAASGTEAINIAKQKKPDLVILDILMSDLDGMTVSQTLKDDPTTKNIPIIFLTGLQPKNEESKNHRSGDNIVFSKPFNSKELVGAIKQLIG